MVPVSPEHHVMCDTDRLILKVEMTHDLVFDRRAVSEHEPDAVSSMDAEISSYKDFDVHTDDSFRWKTHAD